MSFMDWCTSDLSIGQDAGSMSFTDYFGRPWKTSRWQWTRWVSSGGPAVVHSLPCCAMDGAVLCWLPGGCPGYFEGGGCWRGIGSTI